MPGPLEDRIRQKLENELKPSVLEIQNESNKHSVPPNSETHFKVVIVSDRFEGLTRIARQRLVNQILVDEMKPGLIHALTQKTMTLAEWRANGAAHDFQSPDCLGGSKSDKN